MKTARARFSSQNQLGHAVSVVSVFDSGRLGGSGENLARNFYGATTTRSHSGRIRDIREVVRIFAGRSYIYDGISHSGLLSSRRGGVPARIASSRPTMRVHHHHHHRRHRHRHRTIAAARVFVKLDEKSKKKKKIRESASNICSEFSSKEKKCKPAAFWPPETGRERIEHRIENRKQMLRSFYRCILTRRVETPPNGAENGRHAWFFPASVFFRESRMAFWSLCPCFFTSQDVLFPYVRQNLKNYIETKWEDEEFKQDYEKLKEQVNIIGTCDQLKRNRYKVRTLIVIPFSLVLQE